MHDLNLATLSPVEVDLVLASIDEPGGDLISTILGEHDDTDEGRRAALEGVLADENRMGWAAYYYPRVPGRTALTRLTAVIEREQITILAPHREHYPDGLRDLGFRGPHTLFVRGNPAVLNQRSISIVGARAATGYGDHAARQFAEGLGNAGFTIVSGGAYGIDGSAHRGALGVGASTIAYLAGGVDRFYPAGHQELLQRVVDNGAVVSEMPPGFAPTKHRFLARNRLIAAHSVASLVVEAGQRSGSLNEAGEAKKVKRPVFAVPGPITSPASQGTNDLIRSRDARAVSTVEQLISDLW